LNFRAIYFTAFTLSLSLLLTFGADAQKRPGVASKKQWKVFFASGVERKLKTNDKKLEKAITEARKYLGTRHCMGGRSKKCIDCSGLVVNAFEAAGLEVKGRTAQDLARFGKLELNQKKLKRGDLIFFTKTYRTDKLVTHAGIVIGDGKFIHTSSSKGVMISSYEGSGYWPEHFIFGTKL
jgi:cell wall-associated NlpC family hydrolase